MFEEEIKNLTPYEKYIIFIQDLKDQFLFATGAYEKGYMKIEFENTEHTQYYLDNIVAYRNKLANTLNLVKISRSDVDINTLGEYEKQLLKSDKSLFNKVQVLLDKMNNFLSQHNIGMSI